MILLYDFDGTLTPYSKPQYEIMEKCGYNEQKFLERVKKEMKNEKNTNLYESYYNCYIHILTENQIAMTKEVICLGADKVKLNPGVVDYFMNFQSKKTGVKHYIMTSGIKDYVEETPIGQLVDGVYGVTFQQKNGMYEKVDLIVTDQKKVEIIKEIQSINEGEQDIIYFGDGLTDVYAFEYVHSIGGKNVFIVSNSQSMSCYQQLIDKGIIDECFEANFGLDLKISQYIKETILLKRNSGRKNKD